MRGQTVDVGATRVSANGYQYTKVANEGSGKAGWRLTHHLLAEEKLGRPLKADERVSFIKGKTLSIDNIRIDKKGRLSHKRRIAQIEARIEELQAELKQLKNLLS